MIAMAYKYRLTQDWPLNGGRTLLIAGTQIDTNLSKWAFLPLSGFPPATAQPLDQGTFNAMALGDGVGRGYGAWAIAHIGPGITPISSTDPSNPLKCGTTVNSLSCAL